MESIFDRLYKLFYDWIIILLRKTLFTLCIMVVFGHTNVRADDLKTITAQSWLVADSNGKILNGKNTDDVRAIASITKLMTVMVVLDAKQPLSEVVSRKLFNRPLTRRELIELAIVKSNNDAAAILGDSYPGGNKKFVDVMNEKALSLGMISTFFSDPTGRMHTNTSTAEDLIKMVRAASTYPIIVEDSNKDKIVWNESKKKTLVFPNTNSLVGKGLEFMVSKTGFINKAGGCIVMMLNTDYGIRTVVLLGSKDTRTRIPEAYTLAQTDF